MRKLVLIILSLSITGIVVLAGTFFFVPELKWRMQVAALAATGKIPDIEFTHLLRMLKPGSGQYVYGLVETRNPYFVIRNTYTDAQSVAHGSDLFGARCASCHGAGGIGGTAPDLTRQNYNNGDSDWAVYRTISLGVANTAMPAHDLEERSIWSLIAYLRSQQFDSSQREPALGLSVEPVTRPRLEANPPETGNWLSYSGSLDGLRYSELTQIDRSNAHRLQVSWIHQFSGNYSIVETTPLVNGSVMYVTEPPNIIHALDPATGASIWRYEHSNQADLKLCCGEINRGVALFEDMVLMGTLDAHLVAVDAATGKERWKVRLDDHDRGVSITSAPLVVKDLVIVGYGGGDLGLRGFLDARSVKDGSLVWRFYTVPEPGQPGNETWAGDSWKTGGGATWLTGVYDPKLNLLYWGVGNPAPDYQGDLRAGDNLYSCSVIAINPDTGELAWHFQFVPHDERDWDSNQMPALVDIEWEGRERPLILWANRNGFYYVLDRETGEFLQATEFARQNWAERIDENGRPVPNPEAVLTSEGTLTSPSPIGAISWQSTSYSLRTKLHYLPALDWSELVYKHQTPAEYTPGDYFLGGERKPVPNEDLMYSVRAMDPTTGKIAWSYDLPKRKTWWKTGGVVSTAGDLVFGGDFKQFFVLDATNGQELWKLDVGGRINASPITYAVDGKQYFIMAAGRSLVAVGLP
jgi:alcohol dehydrogenase (cytochrome c)